MASEEIAALAASVDVAGIGERIGLRAVEVVAELHNPQDRDIEQLTVAAALSNVQEVLRGIQAGESPSFAQAPEVTLNWATTLAQRGISVAAIPRCYVIGLGIFNAALSEAVAGLEAPESAKWELADRASQYLFGYCEKISGDLVDHYQRERELWARGADSVRTELVLSIVSGRPVDLRATSAALGYDLDRHHAAIIVWGGPGEHDKPTVQALKSAAAKIAHEMKGIELLVVPTGSSAVWAWTSGPSLRPSVSMSIDPPVFAAVGGIGRGVEGFIQSHRQAADGRLVSGVFPQPAGTVVCYPDIALKALLTRDLSAAREFVDYELGDLSSHSERSRRLRSTLIAFFEEGMSWGRTAERLNIHQNTVMYRVNQAKEILHRSLTERRLELEVALRLADSRANLTGGSPAAAAQSDAKHR
jgi:hypothetical protein